MSSFAEPAFQIVMFFTSWRTLDTDAERESLWKTIGYTKGEALEPFSKKVFALLLLLLFYQSTIVTTLQ